MLGRMDDYFIHQTAETIDHVSTGDPRFQDRLYFNVHGRPGDFILGFGLGVFPNQSVMDGFVCAVHAGRQYNLRLARPVTNDRADMFAGPLALDIIEPMRTWRVRLAENDHGINFDLIFQARTAPFEHHPIFRRVDKHVNWHQQHLQQSGTYEGSVTIGGRSIDCSALWGSRDRSWGVRGPMPGTRLVEPIVKPPSAWLSAQFENHVVHGWFGKDVTGRNVHVDGAISRIGEEGSGPHFVDWGFERPGDGIALRLIFTCEGGSEEVLDIIRPLMSRDTEGGGYYAGFFGTKRIASHLEGEIWDIADPTFLKARGTMHGEVLCLFRHRGDDGVGIFQSDMLRQLA